MNKLFINLVAVCIFISMLEAKEYKVYYLGGQSNMEGLGRVEELPNDLPSAVKDVMIFHGNSAADDSPVDGRGLWSQLSPGHGDGFHTDGIRNLYTDRFGIELTFAQKIKELTPEYPIALIKYSRGATSLSEEAAGSAGCWAPDYRGCDGINQYDHFLATLRNAFSVRDIDSDGEEDVLIPAGIIWMQGESDASFTEEIAGRYEQNLKRLMDLIRAALRVDDLPVVIGLITDSGQYDDGKVWDYGEIVQKAQASYVEQDCCAALVTSTKNYSYSDPWHYDSRGFLDLGFEFAKEVVQLQKRADKKFSN